MGAIEDMPDTKTLIAAGAMATAIILTLGAIGGKSAAIQGVAVTLLIAVGMPVAQQLAGKVAGAAG